MNEDIPIPKEIKPFAPYGTAMDVVEDGAHVLFHAVLGGINKGTDAEKRASFMVYVWTEELDGTLTLIPIENPPNNAPRFYVSGNTLMLAGVREFPAGTKTAVRRDVPGYIAPSPPPSTNIDQPARDQAAAVTKMAKKALADIEVLKGITGGLQAAIAALETGKDEQARALVHGLAGALVEAASHYS